MPYTPDPLDDTQPLGSAVQAKDAAPEFRAIKTLLKTLNLAVATTFPTQIAALDTRIDALESHGSQELTGSGNFTVPTGITSLKVTAAAGAVNGWTMKSGVTVYAFKAIADNTAVVTTIAVTPGDVIAYSVGVAEDIYYEYDVGGPNFRIYMNSAATNTVFGSLTVHAKEVNPGLDSSGVALAPVTIFNRKTLDPVTGQYEYPNVALLWHTGALTFTLIPPEQRAILLVEW